MSRAPAQRDSEGEDSDLARATALILTPSMKKYAFNTSIVSVFVYSAGLVPWSLNERLEINAMWSNAYTRFWCRRKSARGIDALPIRLSNTDGGLDCTSAIEEWTREV